MEKHPVLITGATSGLGRKTALLLAKHNWPVIVGGRREVAVHSLCEEIVSLGAISKPFIADQADLKQVQTALKTLEHTQLGGLVLNAGITTTNEAQTAQGYERTFGVNVLSHQLIIRSLCMQLVEQSRVVILSSGVHEPDNKLARRFGIPIPQWLGTRNLALLNSDGPRPDFEGRLRYSTSKLGNVLQARGAQRWLHDHGRQLDVFAVDPGLMVDTNLARELPGFVRTIFRSLGKMATPFVDNMRLSEDSAAHLVSLIEDAKWSGKGFSYVDGDTIRSPSPDAQRDDLVIEFWTESERLINESV